MPRLPLPLFAIACLLAGCGQSGQRKDNMPVVVSAIGRAAELTDPNTRPLDAAERVTLGAMGQGLVRFDAAGQIEPGLAERWIVIDDAKSYIFRLRDAHWPDGQPVTATDVVKALRRATAPSSRSSLAPFLAVIDEVVEMTPQVIEVRLKHPRPDLLKLFAQPELGIFRPHEKMGSGPFLRVPSSHQGLMLRPAELHLGDERTTPSPEEMVRLIGESAAAAIARFRAGTSDLVLGGTVADWPIVAQAGIAQPNIRIDSAAGLFGLAVLRRDGFLADPDNRAAIAMSIDRAALTAAIAPDWKPQETILPDQLDSAAAPAQPDWASLPIDARRATARARVQAWRARHAGPLTIALALPSGPGGTLLWGHLAAALLRIGITPRRMDIDDPSADLKLLDLVAPYDSGRWYLAMACQHCSDEAATRIAAARDAPDLDSRTQRMAEADAMLTADAAFIPIAQPFRWSIVALRLQAWQGNARAWHPLNHLRKAD